MKTFHMVGVRALAFVPTLVLAALIIFLLQRLIPGDIATVIAGDNATHERIAAIREQLGLDQPLLSQFLNWIGGALTGNLGNSLMSGQPVTDLVLDRLPVTVRLAALALAVAALIGIPAGVLAARYRGSWLDSAVTTTATFGIAVPSFWLGLMLIMGFALGLEWFPATGTVPFLEDPLEAIRTMILPATALGLVGAAEICRQVRGAMVETLASDFVRTHHAKGLSEFAITWKHALRNSSLPLVTVVGLQVNRFLGGAVVVELVFGLPGIGSLIVDATNQRDYPIVQGVVFVTALLVLVTNLIVDITYRVLDPRIS